MPDSGPSSGLSSGTTLRPPAPAVRHSTLAAGLLATLLLGLTGCGSDSDAEPSKATVECREKWADLESEVDDGVSGTSPSDLSSRWNAIGASVAHYSEAASSKDCGETLEDQEKAIDALAAFGKQLVPFDMEARLAQVQDGAEEYAEAPRPTPPAPSPSAGPAKGKKAKQPPRNTAPRPTDVAAALKLLTAQAPLASQEQAPGWQQAGVVELDDSAAVAKAVKDLAFLSSESPAFQACTAALATIEAAALASLGD